MNVILSEWHDFKPGREFLGIIHAHQLVAISQVYAEENFGYSQEEKDNFRMEICNFFRKIKRWLPYEKCVLQIYIDDSDEDGEVLVKLTQVGPLDSSANVGLYIWKADSHILCPKREVDIPDIRAN